MTHNLILIPGFGSDERLWAHQIEHLQDIAHIQTLTLRDSNNRQAMADYILDRAPETFILAGHSLGGWVAQTVAAQAPHRVQKLLLVATWARYSEFLVEGIQSFLTRIQDKTLNAYLTDNLGLTLHPDRVTDQALTAAILDMQLNFPEKAYLAQSQAMIADNETYPLLDAIAAPTLVIQARQDQIFPIAESQAIAERIPNAQMVLVEDSGHMLPLEQPQAITALFRLWIESTFLF